LFVPGVCDNGAEIIVYGTNLSYYVEIDKKATKRAILCFMKIFANPANGLTIETVVY